MEARFSFPSLSEDGERCFLIPSTDKFSCSEELGEVTCIRNMSQNEKRVGLDGRRPNVLLIR